MVSQGASMLARSQGIMKLDRVNRSAGRRAKISNARGNSTLRRIVSGKPKLIVSEMRPLLSRDLCVAFNNVVNPALIDFQTCKRVLQGWSGHCDCRRCRAVHHESGMLVSYPVFGSQMPKLTPRISQLWHNLCLIP